MATPPPPPGEPKPIHAWQMEFRQMGDFVFDRAILIMMGIYAQTKHGEHVWYADETNRDKVVKAKELLIAYDDELSKLKTEDKMKKAYNAFLKKMGSMVKNHKPVKSKVKSPNAIEPELPPLL